VPELRIVEDALWQAVKARQAELAKLFEATTMGVREARAKRFNMTRRPIFLLSGLLTCGCCQGKYGIIMNDRYGCLNHHRRGTCSNVRTIRRPLIEQRALSGLTDRLVSPEAVAEAVRAYHEEMNRQNHKRRAQIDADRKALPKVERAIKGIVAAIEDGMYQPAMKARMAELEQQKAEVEARLREAPADLPDVNPNIGEVYRRRIARLAETLADNETSHEAVSALRSLIGDVVLTPGERRGEVHATLRGELMAILDIADGGSRRGTAAPGVITNAVASPRNHRDRHSPNLCSPAVRGLSSDPLQDRTQLPFQGSPELAWSIRRREDDTRDQVPDRQGGLRPIRRIVEGVGETRDLGPERSRTRWDRAMNGQLHHRLGHDPIACKGDRLQELGKALHHAGTGTTPLLTA
jgi:hypothetical protein